MRRSFEQEVLVGAEHLTCRWVEIRTGQDGQTFFSQFANSAGVLRDSRNGCKFFSFYHMANIRA